MNFELGHLQIAIINNLILIFMKKQIFNLVFLLLTWSCATDQVDISISEMLQKRSSVKTQVFDLGLEKSKVIVGANGTKIYYERKDLNVAENEKVILTLKEFYNFEDLIQNQIQTLTASNELLESSGVLFVSFNTGNKKLNLNEDAYLKIYVPENRLKGNEIFKGSMDQMGNMKWEDLEVPKPITKETERIVIDRGVMRNYFKNDTIAYNQGDYFYDTDSLVFNNYINTNGKIIKYLNVKNLEWINIDKYVMESSKFSFNISILNENFDFVEVYIFYNGYQSFLSETRSAKNLLFTEYPIVKNRTNIFVIGYNKNGLSAHKFHLTNAIHYKITLEPTTEEAIIEQLLTR